MTLTPAGHVMRKVFSRMEAMLSSGKKLTEEVMRSAPMQLRVGVVDGADFSALARYCRTELDNSFPGGILEFEAYPFKALHSRLSSGLLEVIFCAETGLKSFEGISSR